MPAAIAAVGAAGLVLSACAGSGAPTDEGRRIEIEMRTFSFTPGSLVLRSGEKVTLVLRNPDSVEHEFMAGREPLSGGGYRDDLLGRLEIDPRPADHGEGHGTGMAVLVQPGRTATVTFVVPADAGAFEYGCFLPGHYEGGMKGALTIEAPAAPAGATAPGAPAATPASTAAAPTAPPTAAPSATDEHAGEGH